MSENNLIVDIVAAQYGLTQNITSAALDSMEMRALRAEAEIQLIRERVQRLYGAAYVPSPASVVEATWPSLQEIDDRVAEMRTNG